MNKRKIIIIFVFVTLIVAVFSLYYFKNKDSLNPTSTSVSDINTNVQLDISDEKINWSNYENREIILTKSITITEEGIYNLSGEITDGLISIKTDGDVKLNLNGVTINNSNGPAIYVESANTVVISTVSETVNSLSDGSNYSGYDEDIEGAIYSKDDLVLEGEGTLVVNGNKKDAIVCKDDLKINSGTYIVTAKDDGIRGKDSVYILNGTFNIDASGDGIKSTNEVDATKGYVKIENGVFNIVSELDGIQAETKILISNGTFNITTGGGSINSSDKLGWGTFGSSNSTSDSAKGIKAGDSIVITDGIFVFDTSDDSIHSNNQVGISGGTYTINSGDDAIHADSELIVDSGEIDIKKSYEGLEAQTITINGGVIKVVASDDGLNAAGGNDGSAINRKGASSSMSSSKSTLTINGGDIYIDASGDGLDANGSIYINDGYIVINGPSNNGNGALDYDSECKITGGTLIATGSSGMAQGISNSSSQYGVLINFTNNYDSGTNITIIDANDNEIMQYTSNKSFSSLVFSSSELSKGNYSVKINGEIYNTFAVSSISSVVGRSSVVMNGGQNGPGNPRGRAR